MALFRRDTSRQVLLTLVPNDGFPRDRTTREPAKQEPKDHSVSKVFQKTVCDSRVSEESVIKTSSMASWTRKDSTAWTISVQGPAKKVRKARA